MTNQKDTEIVPQNQSRLEYLRTLEKEIREGMEEFYYIGMKLQEIRDDELYKEDGFSTFEVYCKERWEWSKSRASQLITAAEYREKIPEFTSGKPGDEAPKWSERSVREFTRIPDKKQAARVAAQVVKAVEDSKKEAAENPKAKPLKPTASTVRKFVDKDLGVNRSEKAKATKAQKEVESKPELRQFIEGLTGRIEAETEKLATVPDEAWKQLRKSSPKTVKRLMAACTALADLLKRAEE